VAYGSGSGQQSVTSVAEAADSNSLWMIKEAIGAPTMCLQSTPIACNSHIRLQHAATRRFLHSHQFTSPLSGQQEISAFGDGEGGGSDSSSFNFFFSHLSSRIFFLMFYVCFMFMQATTGKFNALMLTGSVTSLFVCVTSLLACSSLPAPTIASLTVRSFCSVSIFSSFVRLNYFLDVMIQTIAPTARSSISKRSPALRISSPRGALTREFISSTSRICRLPRHTITITITMSCNQLYDNLSNSGSLLLFFLSICCNFMCNLHSKLFDIKQHNLTLFCFPALRLCHSVQSACRLHLRDRCLRVGTIPSPDVCTLWRQWLANPNGPFGNWFAGMTAQSCSRKCCWRIALLTTPSTASKRSARTSTIIHL
jgi:hypothetical protein